MANKIPSIFYENTGKIIFKSKIKKKIKRLIIFIFLTIVSLAGVIAAIVLCITSIIYLKLPLVLFPSLFYGLFAVLCGIVVYFFTMLSLREFFTFLIIYEKGISILVTHLFPFEYKREYISFENIIDVKFEKDRFGIDILVIYIKNRDPYELDEFQAIDLNNVKNLILQNKVNYFNAKKS
ncbi:MAG: hypothetical protein ACFFBI_04195 [Promethearchaeota archaeon]